MRNIDTERLVLVADPAVMSWRMERATMRLRVVSGRGAALLGFAPEAWSAPGFWAARVHPEDRDRVIGFRRDCLAAGRAHLLEYRATDAEGRTVWLQDIACEARGDEVSGTLIDRTAEAARGDGTALARLVREELSLPLGDAVGFAELLARHLAQTGDDTGSDFALAVLEGLGRLASVSEDLTRRIRLHAGPDGAG